MIVEVESRARESLGIHATSGARMVGLGVVVGYVGWGGRGREGGRGEVESRARESLGGQTIGGGGLVGLRGVVGHLEWGWWVGMLGGRLWAL
jgi:hypothetical protein